MVVSSSKLTPLIPFRENLQAEPSGRDLQGEPLSKPQDKRKQEVSLFERGRDFERGHSPLSITLPSPARKSSDLPDETGWRGDRGEVTTYQPNANNIFSVDMGRDAMLYCQLKIIIIWQYRMYYTQKRIESALRRRGYKITPQRRTIIGAILDTREHLTPAAIHERVSREHACIGLVTVYRTLETLAELGLICETHAGGSCRSYLMRRPSGHHHHLICSDCGKVLDFTDCNLGELERRLAREKKFKINGHLLEFLGQCRQCRKNEAG